jgi:preprotein translocase subunit YajC
VGMTFEIGDEVTLIGVVTGTIVAIERDRLGIHFADRCMVEIANPKLTVHAAQLIRKTAEGNEVAGPLPSKSAVA